MTVARLMPTAAQAYARLFYLFRGSHALQDFVSFADDIAWTRDFVASLRARCGLSKDDVYFYPTEPIGANIQMKSPNS
jgi:hypothetical protein